MKKKLAALLRRWAYALHPETSATLPPGYDLKQVVSQYRYTLKEGKMPEAAVVDSFRDAITDDIIKYVKDAITFRADINSVPGGMVEYIGTLYVGFKPYRRNTTK